MSAPIRVLVVDDSPSVCRLLEGHLHSSGDLQVVGQAHEGASALKLVEELRPDAVTLDMDMPGMSGLEVLDNLMRRFPTPVVLISGVSREAAEVTRQALKRGAVDFIFKYVPGEDTDPDALRADIIARVRTASRVKVIRSLAECWDSAVQARLPTPVHTPWAAPVVVIGASTGGPLTLRELLGEFAADTQAIFLVVQHMPAAFTDVLADQLTRQLKLRVKLAEQGEPLTPGKILLAPGDLHLVVGPDCRVELTQGPKIQGYRPSIDVTMQAAAQVFGARTRGVLLTGMGGDGVRGLAAIRSRGGKTFAQSADTCVVNGMPQQAVDAGVVDRVASPMEIAHLLNGELSLCAEYRRW